MPCTCVAQGWDRLRQSLYTKYKNPHLWLSLLWNDCFPDIPAATVSPNCQTVKLLSEF